MGTSQARVKNLLEIGDLVKDERCQLSMGWEMAWAGEVPMLL